MPTLKTNAIIVAAAAIGIAITLTAERAMAADTDPFVFEFNASELRSENASMALYNRLVRQARSACDTGGRGVQAWRAERECETFLVNEVLEQLGDTTLIAHHADRRA